MVTPPIIETAAPDGRIVRGDLRRRSMTLLAFAEAVRAGAGR